MLAVEAIDGPNTSILGHNIVALVGSALPAALADELSAAMVDATDVEDVAVSLSLPERSTPDFVIALCVGPVVRAVLRGAATLRVHRADGGEITFRSTGSRLVRAIETACVSAEFAIEGDPVEVPAVPRIVRLGAGTASMLRYAATPTDARDGPEPREAVTEAIANPIAGIRSTTSRRAIATLEFGSGELVSVDRTVLIGRSPRIERSSADELPTLVPVESPTGGVSRVHVRVSIEGTGVLLEDLHSTNGTEIIATNGLRFRALPGEPAPLTDGMVVSIGDRVTFRVVSS